MENKNHLHNAIAENYSMFKQLVLNIIIKKKTITKL